MPSRRRPPARPGRQPRSAAAGLARLPAAGLNIADECCAPDFIVHFGGVPGPLHGTAAWKAFASGFLTAFPDLDITIEDLIAEGDRVVGRWSWHGTHLDEFMGLGATGKQVSATGIGLYRIADGKIAEEWVQEDLLGLLQQLGAIPVGQ